MIPVIILLLRLGLSCAFFPCYTVSIDDCLCNLHFCRDRVQFCARRDGWVPCDKMADGWAKLCQGRWRQNPEIALISVWKVSYWPWLGDVQIWTCCDAHQSLGLQNFPPVPMSLAVTSHWIIIIKLKNIIAAIFHTKTRLWLISVPPGLTLIYSTYQPTCFERISNKQWLFPHTAWPIAITEAGCVYCAVRVNI